MDAEKEYKDFIIGKPCGVPECKANGCGHHVRGKNLGGGMGLKPSNLTCIPLCNLHHNELHTIGISTFEKKYGIDLTKELIFWLQAFVKYQTVKIEGLRDEIRRVNEGDLPYMF